MGRATMVVMMYNAVRIDVRAQVMLVRFDGSEIVDEAMNSLRGINEGQRRARREGAKGIDEGDRNRDLDAKSSGKICQHQPRK